MAEEEGIPGAETLWRTTGIYMSKLEQYRRSLHFYDEAVKICPRDKKTLIDRAKARSKVNQFEGALQDIKEAMKIDPHDLLTLAEKAHATYMNCELEDALIQNYRLVPKRKKPEVFTLGIMNCISALNYSLSEICGRPLRDHFLIIRRQAWLKSFQSGKSIEFVPKGKVVKSKSTKKQVTLINKLKQIGDKGEDNSLGIRDSLHSHKSESYQVPRLSTPFKFSPLQRFTTNIENYMSEKYLDRMYRDKLFLKSILKRPGMTSPNPQGSKKLREITKDGFNNVAQKQEVLRTRRPFYYLKFQEARVSGTLKLRQDAELQLKQLNTKKEADKIAQKLESVFEANNLEEVIDMVEKLKSFVDSRSKKIMPDKDCYVQLIHRVIRKAFYKINRINENQVRWDQDKRILISLGQPISREPSTDSVIGYYKSQTVGIDYNAQISLFEERLKAASNDDELCWCYHELARNHMMLKHFDHAKVYATDCIYAARAYNNQEWEVNAKLVLVKMYVKLKSKSEALAEANDVFNLAQKLKDQALQKYVQRCIRVISDLEFDDMYGQKNQEKRQKKILALMTSPQLKEEFAFLFRSMKGQPKERRISIIPGSTPGKKRTSDPSERALNKSKSKLAIEEGENPAGANFMSLVQFHVGK